MSKSRASSPDSSADDRSLPGTPFSNRTALSPAASSATQPFIYPIRSAVSIKPSLARKSSSHSNASSQPTQDITSPVSTTGTLPHRPASGSAHLRTQTNSSIGFEASGDVPTDAAGPSQRAASPSESASALSSSATPRGTINGYDTRDTDMLDPAERDRIESMTQTRFKHVETEDGHMILTGRDGELLRCEDEPIHIPGAVQSFGCLVVIREEPDGSLLVRQASENTASIIGWTPNHLFRLESFLDCLEEDQADILWDAIESLEENETDLVEAGPHVFQLSGFGQPSHGIGKARARMHWHCWCAAHRTFKGPAGAGATTILEFEPVRDTRFPLMSQTPMPTPADELSEDQATDSCRKKEGTVTTIDPETGETKVSKMPETMNGHGGLDGMPYVPTLEQLEESTKSTSKPIKALSRLRQKAGEGTTKRSRPRKQGGNAGPGLDSGDGSSDDSMLDMFGILTQINEQFTAQQDLQSFLKVVVGVVRDLTRFSRVMIYQFDEEWNGQVVCELVDTKDTHDLYRGLNFPATDIPKQARDLYRINKVRLLYDRDLPTSRMVCREKVDLETPVDMTHSFLRAMSPIHVKYLENMGVRASMSCSIMAFGQLWGLISLHTYGLQGHRVSFPMRQLLRLLGESVSRNIERLSYTKRLQSRKLINTLPTASAPSGYILTKAEELLELFDADFGVISIGTECKILGGMSASQEVLALTEFLRLKRLPQIFSTSNIARDFPDMDLPEGLDLEMLAGVLYIPLTEASADFIVFIRRAQNRTVSWAGKPFKEGHEEKASLEPRKSFKLWNQTITGTCRAWKDEELETASVLCLVYGKFITVWRSKEAAMQYNQLNRLLLSNASHEVRTPLHHLVSYLEMALDGALDAETRENLNRGRIASKSLLFTINDLLDISRAEQGKQLFLQEPFDLAETVREAVEMYEWEAKRQKISFKVITRPQTCMVLGDRNRLRQVLVNTTSNAIRHTGEGGSIYVEMKQRKKGKTTLQMPEGTDVEIELSISDTGCGIARERLEAIFREFEQVESVVPEEKQQGNEARDPSQSLVNDALLLGPEGPSSDQPTSASGLGVGLAVVARIVRNLKGQLRVDSTVGVGSRFSYLIPFQAAPDVVEPSANAESEVMPNKMVRSHSRNSLGGDSRGSSANSQLDSLVEALGAPNAMALSADNQPDDGKKNAKKRAGLSNALSSRQVDGVRQVRDSRTPLRPTKVDPHSLDGGSANSGDSAEKTRPIMPKRKSNDSKVSGAGVSEASTTKRSAVLRRNQNTARAAAATREKVSPLRVLVVEDDPINRMILKKRLGMDGHTVLLAFNGEEGVQSFTQQSAEIDLVLMDLQMPICNGQDACKRIRALENERKESKDAALAARPHTHQLNGRVPIFAVSATLTPEMREEMCEIGMDGWILKPVDFARLNILLKGVIETDKRKQELWKPGKNWEKGGWLCAPPVASDQPSK
ncbi:unnamed protein product [Sympodiomycopsis kandeliae]